MKTKAKYLITTISYVFIILATIYAVVELFNADFGFGMGPECFRYFTIESNIFMAITAAITIGYIIKNNKEEKDLPLWLLIMLLSSTSAVTLTFITVAVFLGPVVGYSGLFSNGNLFMHLITPLISAGIYCVFLNKPTYNWKFFFFGFAPTFIYGLMYIICVFGLKIWPDFYNFNLNGMWFVIFPLMVIGSLTISFGIYEIRKLLSKL